MLIVGISLQLLAGIILGLPHILGEGRFEDANKKLKQFFLSASSGRQRLRILILGALIITVASLIVLYLVEKPTDVRWYEVVGGLLFGYLMTAIFYLSFLRGFARLISKVKDPKTLPDDTYFRTLLLSNLILIPVFVALASLSLLGNSALSTANVGNLPEAVILFLRLLLVFLFVFSDLSACISIVFIVLAGIIKLMSLMARPARILWIIILSIYTLGGALLIASACQS